MRHLFSAARPRQWAKNVLVFAAPGALGVLDETDVIRRSSLLFVAFCAVSSGLYLWNDVMDVEQDRLHPRKRHRPVAAGTLSATTASLVGSFSIASGLILSSTVSMSTGAVVAAYAVATLLYSVKLKYVPLLDVMVVASGFVLRAVAGAVGTETPMSAWFLLCTMFGSLFVVSGKRYSEFLETGGAASESRSTLRHYSRSFLQMLVLLSCVVTLVAYCLWAFEGAGTTSSDLPFYEITIAPMLLCLLRYLQLLEAGEGGAPEEIFFGDRPIQIYGLVWLGLYGAAIYTR